MIVCYQHKVFHTDSRIINNPISVFTYPTKNIVIPIDTLLPYDFEPYRTSIIAAWKIKEPKKINNI